MAYILKYWIKNLEPLRIADDSSSQMGQTTTLRYLPGSTIRGFLVNALAKKPGFEEKALDVFSERTRFSNAYPLAFSPKNEPVRLIPAMKGFYEDRTPADKESRKEMENTLQDGKSPADKESRKEMKNVLQDGNVPEGYKRSRLGDYVYLSENCVDTYQLRIGSDQKIKMNVPDEDRSVFRNAYIEAGYIFEGSILSENRDLLLELQSVLENTNLILGNARSAGLGKCRLESFGNLDGSGTDKWEATLHEGGSEHSESTGSTATGKCRLESCTNQDALPYVEYLCKEDREKEVYMMLLSNTVMRSAQSGEYCGLDLEALGASMGVENLEIRQCATSSVVVRGFNRKWEGRVPSVTMYEQGSVFKLGFTGIFTRNRMLSLMQTGIGERRNEGFGAVLFLEDYASLSCHRKGTLSMQKSDIDDEISEKYKEARKNVRIITEEGKEAQKDDGKLTEEDRETLQVAARGYCRAIFERRKTDYIANHKLRKGNISQSQLGKIEAFITAFRFDCAEAEKSIRAYLGHAAEKQAKERVLRESYRDFGSIEEFVTSVIRANPEAFGTMLGDSNIFPSKVMGLPLEEVLTEEEIGRMKMEFLSDFIRFDNKREGL